MVATSGLHLLWFIGVTFATPHWLAVSPSASAGVRQEAGATGKTPTNWGRSSIGRALPLQGRGCRFDPGRLQCPSSPRQMLLGGCLTAVFRAAKSPAAVPIREQTAARRACQAICGDAKASSRKKQKSCRSRLTTRMAPVTNCSPAQRRGFNAATTSGSKRLRE